MKNLSIRLQLIIIFIVFLISSIIGAIFFQYSITKMENLGKSKFYITTVNKDILILRKNEKDFLARKDMKYFDKFNKNFNTLLKNIEQFKSTVDKNNKVALDEIDRVEKSVKKYREKFIELVKIQQKIGLHYKDGLYGGLRKAVHQAEVKFKEFKYDKLLKDMLTLRRNEKDFMLRYLDKYITKFNTNYEKMKNNVINSTKLTDEAKSSSLESLKIYKERFLKFADGVKEKGLNPKSGKLGELRKIIHESSAVVNEVTERILDMTNVEIFELRKFNLIIVVVNIVVVIILLLIISRRIYSEILSLRETATDLADNGEADLTQRLNINGNNEITQANSKINKFIERIQSTLDGIKSSSSETASVANELSVTAMQVGKRVEKEAEIIEGNVKSSEDITALINSSVEKATATKDDIISASDNLNSVRAEILNMVSKIQHTSEVEAELSSKLNQLSNDAEQVKSVLTVINDIADQTNLLALNAAIEAARAGEHGRGFAVVADEVRQLAERTQKSLNEINTTISVIVQAIIDASDNMNKNAETIQDLSSVSTQVESKINETNKIMNESVSVANESLNDSVDIATKLNARIKNTAHMSQLANSNARNVEEMATAIEHLHNMTEELSAQLNSFKT